MAIEQNNIDDSKAAAVSYYEKIANLDFRHNAVRFVSWESIWGLGIPFASYNTMIPSYLAELKSPKLLIAIIMSLTTASGLMQVLFSHMYKNKPRKKWLTSCYITSLIPWLIYCILILLFPNAISPKINMAFFALSMVIYIAGCTGNSSLYISLLTDCTPVKKRGSLFGYRIGGMAAGVVLMSPASAFIMNKYPEPQNYLIAFIAGISFYICGSAFLMTVREHRNPRVLGNKNHNSKVSKLIPSIRLMIRRMTKNPNYLVFFFFISLFFISNAIGSLIVVFAKESLNLKGAAILPFTIILFASSAIGSIVLGKVADKTGYKTIGVIQGFVLMISFIIFLILSTKPAVSNIAVYLAFFLYASTSLTGYMVLSNMSIELLPKQNNSMLIAIANVLMTPAILIITPLAGLLIDITVSYVAVFATGAVFALISSCGFMMLVREPRKKRMYAVRYIRRI